MLIMEMTICILYAFVVIVSNTVVSNQPLRLTASMEELLPLLQLDVYFETFASCLAVYPKLHSVPSPSQDSKHVVWDDLVHAPAD